MVEKAIIIHRSVIVEWGTRNKPPMALSSIQRALQRIDEIIKSTKPEDVVYVEESPNTGFTFLPERVGVGNTARLYGARAGHCLKTARVVLEDAGIPVSLDNEGSLP
jgi:hypothetical protein